MSENKQRCKVYDKDELKKHIQRGWVRENPKEELTEAGIWMVRDNAMKIELKFPKESNCDPDL